MKVIIVLNHAPHYREQFLREFGKYCELTVFAKPCTTANLIEPTNRLNYDYYESDSIKLFKNFAGLQVNPSEFNLLRKKEWNKIILSWDLHHILRFIYFLFSKEKNKIYWMGHIYGRYNNLFFKFIRNYFLNKSGGVLVYSDEIQSKLKSDMITVPIISFNNSEIFEQEIQPLPFNFKKGILKLLFVGRYQPRKMLHKLVYLAIRRSDVEVIIAGNGMDMLIKEINVANKINNLKIFGETLNDDLIKLMEWCDIIANPGHLGLLVINGARFGRPIIVDNQVEHAPEIIVAKEAKQFFCNWDNEHEVDELISNLIYNRKLIIDASQRVVSIVKSKYTINNMVNAFVSLVL